MHWTEITSSRSCTMMDEWTEYLCIRLSPENTGGWEVGICGMDEEGDLVPMTDDATTQISSISPVELGDAALSLGWGRAENWALIAERWERRGA